MLTLECANKTLCQNYTVIYRRLHRYGTALTEEQLGQHEILRRIRLRAPPQDDIVSFEGGCAPFTPALRVRTKLSGCPLITRCGGSFSQEKPRITVNFV